MQYLIKRGLAFLAGVSLLFGSVTLASPAQAAVPIVPPGKPGVAKASTTALLTTNYFYNLGRQTLTAPDKSTGMSGNLRIQKPFLASGDYHSLAEIAVQSADSKQIVEVGWTVDRTTNSACTPTPACKDDPYIFVGNWVNGVFRGYNSSSPDWVDYASNPVNPGPATGSLASVVDLSKQFNIQISGGNWWIGYDLQWLGYFKASAWTGVSPAFDGGYLHQAFGEVASSITKPCTDMGSGVLGTATTGIPARLGSLNLLTTPTAENFVASVQPSTASSVYAVNALSATTIAYGGPGWNAAGTGVGTKGAC